VLSAWARIPSAWTYEQAAAAGLACSAAIAALDALGDLAGKTLLIEGGAGGVGTAATQIATARGASVIGTARSENHEFLHSLGAVAATTYGPGLADRISVLAPAGIHAAIDAAGSGTLGEIVEIVGDPNLVVSLADFSASTLGVALIAGDSNAAANFAEAARLGGRGEFTPQVVRTYPLVEIADAHAVVQQGHTDGKIVLTV
jgi:NADPH:quinone reductase-like Zn-dependent oxidoreductase